MSSTKTLVLWNDGNKTSILDLSPVREEDRFTGSDTRIKWGGGEYAAKILRISKNLDELERFEEEFMSHIMEKEPSSKRPRSSVNVPGIATTNQVQLAVGEKPSLPQQHADAKAKLRESDKAKKSSQKAVEKKNDRELFNVKKILFEPNVETTRTSRMEEDDNLYFGEADTEELDDRPDSYYIEIGKLVCREATLSLIRSLLTIFDKSSTQDCRTEGHEIKLKINPPGCKKVDISKGSAVWIDKLTRSRLVSFGAGDPYKLTRDLLVELFGRETLSIPGLSAKGNGPNNKRIAEHVLGAMYDFVCRDSNVDGLPAKDGKKEQKQFTYPVFIKEINRKLESVRRCPENRSGTNGTRKTHPKFATASSKSKASTITSKSKRTPIKTGATPSKTNVTPLKTGVTPLKLRRAPSKASTTPSKSRPLLSKAGATPSKSRSGPSKTSATPFKAYRTPSKKSSVSPSKKSVSPQRRASPPQRRASPPQRRAPPLQRRTSPLQRISALKERYHTYGE